MLSGQGRLIVQGEPDRPARAFIYLPVDVARDSQFPFVGTCQVDVLIDLKENGLVIRASADSE